MRGLTQAVLTKIGLSVVTLWLISILVFVLVRVLPGDPAELMVNPTSFTGDRAAALARIRNQLGLDQSLPVQYVRWLGQLFQGNLGYSYADGRPVVDVLSSALGATLEFAVPGLIIAMVVGTLLGVLSALRSNTLVDYTIGAVSIVFGSIPTFFTGLAAISIFALTLRWFPSGGQAPDGASFTQTVNHLLLPSLILAAVLAVPWIRYARASMLDTLDQEFMLTARAKGIPERRVVLRHGLHNALLPLITFTSLQIPSLLAGAVFIEEIFSWPGIGQTTLTAITGRDYPVVVGYVMFIAIVVVVCNLVADICYVVTDPRIRS